MLAQRQLWLFYNVAKKQRPWRRLDNLSDL